MASASITALRSFPELDIVALGVSTWLVTVWIAAAVPQVIMCTPAMAVRLAPLVIRASMTSRRARRGSSLMEFHTLGVGNVLANTFGQGVDVSLTETSCISACVKKPSH